ncbi:MAG: ATP-binding protein, partial [Candidatus Aenigmarchaeota archaeon]|nr:ATP-binding protein [Candidatus Aenigmarchaeota archaeon]
MRDERLKTWLNNLNWSFNPFVFDIRPEYMVGFEKYIDNIHSAIEQSSKYIIITAATGSGKTMLMNYLHRNPSENANYIYISKPPRKPEEFAKIMESQIRENKRKSQNAFANFICWLSSQFKKEEITLYNLSSFIERNSKHANILLIDEAHETNIETLEW